MSNPQFPQNPNWQTPGAPQAPKHAAPKQKPFGWAALTVATVSALTIGGCSGMLAGSAGKTAAEPGSVVTVTEKPQPAPTKTVTEKAPEPKKKAEEPKEEPPADEDVSDGIYQVGDEIAPGRYKTTVPGGLFVLCVYQRLRDDSGDDDAIITYELANEGEKVSVTLKKGEFFSTDGCGTWKRVS